MYETDHVEGMKEVQMEAVARSPQVALAEEIGQVGAGVASRMDSVLILDWSYI